MFIVFCLDHTESYSIKRSEYFAVSTFLGPSGRLGRAGRRNVYSRLLKWKTTIAPMDLSTTPLMLPERSLESWGEQFLILPRHSEQRKCVFSWSRWSGSSNPGWRALKFDVVVENLWKMKCKTVDFLLSCVSFAFGTDMLLVRAWRVFA